jgi:hypothetical protein
MLRDSIGESSGDVRMTRSKVEECENRGGEIFNVVGLLPLASIHIRLAAFCVGLGRSLGVQFNSHCGNPISGCPDTTRKRAASLLLLHRPAWPARFDSTSQGGITWRQ